MARRASQSTPGIGGKGCPSGLMRPSGKIITLCPALRTCRSWRMARGLALSTAITRPSPMAARI